MDEETRGFSGSGSDCNAPVWPELVQGETYSKLMKSLAQLWKDLANEPADGVSSIKRQFSVGRGSRNFLFSGETTQNTEMRNRNGNESKIETGRSCDRKKLTVIREMRAGKESKDSFRRVF